jgi:hypothetical protein
MNAQTLTPAPHRTTLLTLVPPPLPSSPCADHYHSSELQAPYTVRCLRGCIQDNWGNRQLSAGTCTQDATQYDYSSLDISWLANSNASYSPAPDTSSGSSSNSNAGGNVRNNASTGRNAPPKQQQGGDVQGPPNANGQQQQGRPSTQQQQQGGNMQGPPSTQQQQGLHYSCTSMYACLR